MKCVALRSDVHNTNNNTVRTLLVPSNVNENVFYADRK
jgi:hypothetical protein